MVKTGKAPSIHPMFNGILSCPVCAILNGPNETITFKSGKGVPIQHWILLVPMKSNALVSQAVKSFLSDFQKLYQLPDIQMAYKTGVACTTTHQGLISQVSEKGNYWKVFDEATGKEVISQYCDSLSEVLQDFTIKEIVFTMFNGEVKKDPNTWDDDFKSYAFGK